MVRPKYLEKNLEGQLEEKEGEETSYQLPSNMFKNIYAMIDDPDMKPPFFKDYILRIDDKKMKRSAKWNGDQPPTCFSFAEALGTSIALAASLAIVV